MSTTITLPATPSDLVDAYALERVEYQVNRLRTRLGLNRHDAEDVRQDLVAELCGAAPRFDPSKASRKTFICRVLTRAAAHIARSIRNRRKCAALSPRSLSTMLPGDWAHESRGVVERGMADRIGQAMDLGVACDQMPRQRRLIAEDLKHYSVDEIAGARGMHRGSVYRAIGQIRHDLAAAGVGLG